MSYYDGMMGGYGYNSNSGMNNYPNSNMNRPPQQRMMPQNNGIGTLRGRPVSSFDEVKSTIIDFDGSVFYFPDNANKKIYTKQINVDGSPIFRVYQEVQMQEPKYSNDVSYVSDEKFQNTINMLLDEINMLKGELRNNHDVQQQQQSTSNEQQQQSVLANF